MNTLQLPGRALGFDCNTPLSTETAKKFRDDGYVFVVRYVPRVVQKSIDVTAAEVQAIHAAGLAIMPVQHVENPGWTPSADKGAAYGKMAAESARKAGITLGTCCWLDLEGVGRADEQVVIDYCNRWFDEVARVGYTPGIYVGYEPGIGARALYSRLKFEHYWAAYNLNSDQYPAVRGVQMQQRTQVKLHGIEIDPDDVFPDAKGGLPLACMPDEWAP